MISLIRFSDVQIGQKLAFVLKYSVLSALLKHLVISPNCLSSKKTLFSPQKLEIMF